MSLNWEDERYVRWYTRNTPEWSSLSWQARGLFGLIMREVDRAGVLAVGKLGLKGIAVSVRAPWREIEPFMAELLADGCVRFRDGKLLIPNFLEAQEARQSDRARSQASRERRKAMADGSSHGTATAEQDVTFRDDGVTFRDDGVTFRDDSSHAVTGGHTPSHAVTPSCAVPNLTIPVGVTDSDDSEPEDPFPVISRTYAEAVNAAAHRFHDPNRWANPEDSEALLWAWRRTIRR